jgi:hypothetical protein
MRTENKRCNGLVLEPPCTTWPPPWLLSPAATPTPSTLPRVAAEPKVSDQPPDVSPWDLPPDLYERWEERVCIMHFDGWIPWKQAEALALADVLRQADSPVGTVSARAESARPKPTIGIPEEPAAAVQRNLFAVANGPYG